MEEKGERKLSMKATTPESVTFMIREEDHTLGNALRYMLAKNPEVDLAGYSIPHPSEPLLNVRVQTKGSTPAIDAFRDALSETKGMLQHMLETYQSEKAGFQPSDNMEE
eukprot:TRINITY_DN6661_c0_g1_i1.p1 TRINITY_DN6661_c0_g1~~TRINITY_DN6661_c0_g1_i1.p1  ORF type:complete len:109 (-),score=5.97 TRINITY_DN6661_c0_g1_i1:19-345(-)